MRKHSRHIKARQLHRARWGTQWRAVGPMYGIDTGQAPSNVYPIRPGLEPAVIDYDIP